MNFKFHARRRPNGGYVMSKKTLTKFVKKLMWNLTVCGPEDGYSEDIYMSWELNECQWNSINAILVFRQMFDKLFHIHWLSRRQEAKAISGLWCRFAFHKSAIEAWMVLQWNVLWCPARTRLLLRRPSSVPLGEEYQRNRFTRISNLPLSSLWLGQKSEWFAATKVYTRRNSGSFKCSKQLFGVDKVRQKTHFLS